MIEFVEYNNNDLRFNVEIRSKARYINFIIMKPINYNLYCIFINY